MSTNRHSSIDSPRVLLLLLALWLAVATTSSLALAQPAIDAEGKAKGRFQEGIALFSAQKYEESLTAFEESYALRPKAQVLFNIAMCQKALFRYAASITTFEMFLQVGALNIPKSHRAKANAAVTEMEALVSRVTFEDTPEGAFLTVNSQLVGQMPLEHSLILDPGRHLLALELAGFEPLRLTVTASAGVPIRVRADLQTLDNNKAPDIVAATSSSHVMTVDPQGKGLLLGGIISTTVALGLLIPGSIFTAKWAEDYRIMDTTLAWEEYSAAKDRLPTERAVGIVCLATGAALVGLGVVLFVLDHRKSKATGRLRLGASATGVTIDFQ